MEGARKIFALGLKGPVPLDESDLLRDWLIIGEHGSGKTNTVRLLADLLPDHQVLANLSAQDPRLTPEVGVLAPPALQPRTDLSPPLHPPQTQTKRAPLIASVSPQILQTTFSGPLAELRARARLIVLGSATQCRPFLKGVDCEALPDQIGLVPGRGILIKEGKGLAIQIAIYPKLR